MKTLSISLSIILSVLASSNVFANNVSEVFQTAEKDMLTITVVAKPNPVDYEVIGWEKADNAIDGAMEIMLEDLNIDKNLSAVKASNTLNTSI